MDPFDELVERVKRLTGLTGRAASAVAMACDVDREAKHSAGEVESDSFSAITPAEIVNVARELGYNVDTPEGAKTEDALSAGLRRLQLEPDAAEVLRHVYLTMPRVLNQQVPVIGRAPKESVFYSEGLQEQIDALPEDVRVLIGGVDLVNGQVTFHLYDEANDLDRAIGPIDLTQYATGEQLRGAIEVLLARLPRVLSSDFN